jgi:hypothetical protein
MAGALARRTVIGLSLIGLAALAVATPAAGGPPPLTTVTDKRCLNTGRGKPPCPTKTETPTPTDTPTPAASDPPASGPPPADPPPAGAVGPSATTPVTPALPAHAGPSRAGAGQPQQNDPVATDPSPSARPGYGPGGPIRPAGGGRLSGGPLPLGSIVGGAGMLVTLATVGLVLLLRSRDRPIAVTPVPAVAIGRPAVSPGADQPVPSPGGPVRVDRSQP